MLVLLNRSLDSLTVSVSSSQQQYVFQQKSNLEAFKIVFKKSSSLVNGRMFFATLSWEGKAAEFFCEVINEVTLTYSIPHG